MMLNLFINKQKQFQTNKKSLNSHKKKSFKIFLIIFLMCVKNWKSRVKKKPELKNYQVMRISSLFEQSN